MEGGTDLQGRAAGDDDGGQGHQRQHQAAHQRGRARHAEDVEKHGQPQQTEDNGGHGRQVVDVDFDQIGPAVFRGEFFQVDGRRHPHGKGERQGDQQRIEAAAHGAPDAGQLRFAAVAGREKGAVELLGQLGPGLAVGRSSPIGARKSRAAVRASRCP